MSEIRALDELGVTVGAALRRELPRVRRRRRLVTASVLASVVVAVPAAGTATNWAGLAGGETPLPTQVDPATRATLASGVDSRGGWRVEAYRAALSGRPGTVGVCVFASRRDGGAGRCAPADELGPLSSAGESSATLGGLVGGVVRDGVTRVEVTVRPYEAGGPTRVVAVTPAVADADALRARDLPADLRPFVVLVDPLSGGLPVGVRALGADGRTLAVSGRPAAARPQVVAGRSPSSVEEVRP